MTQHLVPAAAPVGSVTSVPVTASDRLCRIGSVVVRLGPLRIPPRAAIVDALYALASVGPEVRIGLVPAADGRRWRWDPVGLRARCEAMVVEWPGDVPSGPATGSGLDAALDGVIAAVDPGSPVRIVLAGSSMLLVFDHSLVDSRFTVGLPSALLTVAAGGAMPDWVTAPVLRRPVLAALVATHLRHPRTVLALLDARRRARAAARRGAAQGSDLPRVPAARDADLPRVPWAPDTTVVWAAGTPDGFRDTRAWIRATDPALSFGAVLLVMLRAAFRAEGIDVAAEADMVYDVRRYLPEGGQTNGNFITGIPVAGGEDPAAVEEELARTLRAGRPVAALAAGVVKEAVRPHRAAAPRLPGDAPLFPAARISLSNIGISRPLQNLPWAPAQTHQVVYGMHPLPPEQVSVQAMIIDRALQLTVSFNGNVFRREAVERAMQRVVHEPVAVLGERSGQCERADGVPGGAGASA